MATANEEGEVNTALVSWENKIVGTEEVDPQVLMDNPHNWRQHSKDQRKAMADLLDELGWVQNVIVNKNTQRIVDGHLRVQLAKERKEPTIPVVLVDLTEEEERLALAMVDTITEMATTNRKKARALAKMVKARNESMQITFMDTFGDQFLEEETDEEETDAAFADNPMAEGLEDINEGKNRPTPLRVMQIYLYPHLQEHIMATLKRLGKVYETNNVTDTVIEAVERAGTAEFDDHTHGGPNLPAADETPAEKDKGKGRADDPDPSEDSDSTE